MNDLRPVVSIVIVSKDGLQYLRQSFPVILSQSTNLPYEILLIDSGSTDGSVAFVERCAATDARIRLIQIPSQEFHHARTRNLGAELAKGRYVAFLGGDAVPVDSGWLAGLLEPLRGGDDPLVVATYARQVPRAGANVVAVCRTGYNYGATALLQGRDLAMSQKERYHFSTVSCCLDTVRVVPPLFDPTYPVGEDIALSRRIIDAGSRIAYVPESIVAHSHDYSGWDLMRRYYDNAVIHQRLSIFAPIDTSLGGDGMRYWVSSMSVLRRRSFGDLARFVFGFGCSAIGLQMGLYSRWLPSTVRRALSVYWTAND